MQAVLYIHGMGGSADESARYEQLFPSCRVSGLDYEIFTPWETGPEIRAAAEELSEGYGSVILIANSIGAYFSLHAGIDRLVRKAYFISPVTDMQRLILDRMAAAGVSEAELRKRGTVPEADGPDLSWEYLRWVREHPVRWSVPTQILCGSEDRMVPFETVRVFADACGAEITVMRGGEHWFHTKEQMRFLDSWIRSK